MSLNSLSPTTDPATGGPDSAHFEDSLRQALLKDSPADARIADSGTGAPAFESGGSFAWSGELANASALTFTDAEGKVTVFSQALTPELFARVKADASAWSIINAQTADGTREYLGSGQLIDQAQIQIMGWPEELGNGLIQFQTSDGKNYIVSERSNAEMYERVLTVNTPLPTFESGGSYAWDGELDTATRIVFTDAQGAQTTFSQDVSPTLFAQLKADAGAWQVINQQTAGGAREYLGGERYIGETDIDRVGWADELGNGLIQFHTRDGKEYIVSERSNPQMYERVVALDTQWSAGTVTGVRDEAGLGKLEDLDLLNMPTTQLSDEKDAGSAKLSVSEAALTRLLDDYKKGVADGSIGKDDDRARLVLVMEAKAALQSGRGITGYEESLRPFNTTWRESDDKQTLLTAADEQDIIDGNKVDSALQELFAKEGIAGDYQDKLTAAIETLPDRAALAERIDAQLNSEQYLKYLGTLNDQGYSTAATEDVQTLLRGLQMLDPEKAKVTSQNLSRASITVELDKLIADPALTNQENKDLALKDELGLIKSILKSETLDIPRRTQETIEKFINEFVGDKTKLTSLNKVIEELTKNADGKPVSQADIDAAMAKTYVPIKDRNAMGAALDTLNSNGILGSLGGAVSLGSAIYQLAGKGGMLADDPLERLSIAKDFISFLGAGAHFTNTAAFSKLISTGAVDLLGLKKTLPEIWAPEGKLGAAIAEVKPTFVLPETAVVSADFGTEMATAVDDIFQRDTRANPAIDLPGVTPDMTDGITQSITSGTPEGSKPSASSLQKIAGSTLKVLSVAGDTFGGVADIVLGAFTIKSGVQSGSDLQKAAGSLQVVGGVAGGIAGGIGVAGLFGAAGAAAAFTGPLFLLSVVLVGIAGIIGYFVDHEKKQKATNRENDWYATLDQAGLLQENWANKVEYAHYSIHHYGQRDAPTEMSIFDYQAAEWQHFMETEQKGGSSTNRLDEGVHQDWDGDAKNKVVKEAEEPDPTYYAMY
jgi:hypothetical protein